MTITQHTINTPYMVGPIHCYSAEINGELVLFDTGPPTSTAKMFLREHLDLGRLKYIFITHCHIDHYGLVSWLEKKTDAQLFIPYRDGLKMLEHRRRLQEVRELLAGLGFSGRYLDELYEIFASSKTFPEFPKSFRIVEDDLPKELDLGFFGCPGHSQSDIIYFTEEWAVTGDVLLKGVFQSPLLDVDLETGERFKNYEAYCATLKKVATLRGKQICPAHRDTIDSVDTVVLFYIPKMLHRATALTEKNLQGNVAEILDELFDGKLRDPFHLYLKASEVVFLQDFLKEPERLKNSLQAIGLFSEVEESYNRALVNEGATDHDRPPISAAQHRGAES